MKSVILAFILEILLHPLAHAQSPDLAAPPVYYQKTNFSLDVSTRAKANILGMISGLSFGVAGFAEWQRHNGGKSAKSNLEALTTRMISSGHSDRVADLESRLSGLKLFLNVFGESDGPEKQEIRESIRTIEHELKKLGKSSNVSKVFLQSLKNRNLRFFAFEAISAGIGIVTGGLAHSNYSEYKDSKITAFKSFSFCPVATNQPEGKIKLTGTPSITSD